MRGFPCLLVGLVLVLASCASPGQVISGGQAPQGLEGRFSGGFLSQSGAMGGSARFVLDGAAITGSVIDRVWAKDHQGQVRTGTLRGTLDGSGGANLTINWSTGQEERLEGTWTSPGPGSLGINLPAEHGGGIVFAMHEGGVPARPPYGVPPDRTMPDFLAQFAGEWVCNWYDSQGDWGTGTISIDRTGKGSGALVNDAYSDPPSAAGNGEASHATVTIRIAEDGALGIVIGWAGGGETETLEGNGYFEAPETLSITAGRSISDVAQGGPRLVLTLHRQ